MIILVHDAKIYILYYRIIILHFKTHNNKNYIFWKKKMKNVTRGKEYMSLNSI